ncbi:hypothetical protein C5D07_05675 [Rathayibacter tritici]|uniref:hypothetical protein n=1 Tax=Rathayibacter tritici TaxID=33888 RepID=UPI000CE85119|nr:hypothetical protein [Rathayibacter tritici]PPF31014.1 hypothetical protein C5C06_03500 [Rathayibacter tritici]PPI16737.1 hypothetical protein C5D07_05675 [Rathayibacter tritici]
MQDFIDRVGWNRLDYERGAGSLLDWLDENKAQDQGFLFGAVSADNRSYELYWSGASPLSAAAVARGKELNLDVTIVDRPFAWKDIDRQARATMAAAEEFRKLGFVISAVKTLSKDTADLVVVGSYVDPTTAQNANSLGEKARSLIQDKLSSLGPISTQITSDVKAVNHATASRNDDNAPYYGGGFMYSYFGVQANSAVCSSGFSLRFDSNNATTTARHCQPPGGSWTSYDNYSSHLGGIVATSPDYGAARLESAGSGRVFDGGVNSSSSVPVKGHQAIGIGNEVCSEGGNTGVSCGGVIDNMAVLWNDGQGDPFYNIQAEKDDWINAGGNSGGPMVVPWSDGFGAVGMIQYGNTPTSCPSLAHSEDVDCYRGVGFTSIQNIAEAWGAGLVTG